MTEFAMLDRVPDGGVIKDLLEMSRDVTINNDEIIRDHIGDEHSDDFYRGLLCGYLNCFSAMNQLPALKVQNGIAVLTAELADREIISEDSMLFDDGSIEPVYMDTETTGDDTCDPSCTTCNPVDEQEPDNPISRIAKRFGLPESASINDINTKIASMSNSEMDSIFSGLWNEIMGLPQVSTGDSFLDEVTRILGPGVQIVDLRKKR